MSDEFSRTLSRPEARHRYWHIRKADRDFFPPDNKIFRLEFHDQMYELKVNHKGDVMTGKLYEHYKFVEGDPIVVKKKKNGTYVLTAEETKSW